MSFFSLTLFFSFSFSTREEAKPFSRVWYVDIAKSLYENIIVLGSWEEGLGQCGAHLYLLINIILILSWIFRFISWEKWLQIELAQKTGGSTSVVYPVTPLFTRYLLCLLNWIIYCLMKFLGLSGGGMGEW